jgi:excisionase family DNA binding protein
MAKKLELLTKEIAAERLNLSVRRLMEISAEGKLTRHREFDPSTRREAVMFDAAEVAALVEEWTPKSLVVRPLELPPGNGEAEPADRDQGRLWLTIAEAADYTGLPASFLHRLVDERRLPAFDVGVRPGGRLRVKRADLEMLSVQ